jgi:hypothetical protein
MQRRVAHRRQRTPWATLLLKVATESRSSILDGDFIH